MVYPFFHMESYVQHGKRIAWKATYRAGSISHGKRTAQEATHCVYYRFCLAR